MGALIPLWVRLLAFVVIVAGAFAFGFTNGLSFESDRRDALELKAEKEFQELFKKHQRVRKEIEVRYVKIREKVLIERPAV